MDLQLTLSKSKATSTTVQDVHPDIASAMVRKRPGKITICLTPERCSYISNNVKKTKQGEAYLIVPYSSIFILFLSHVLNYSPNAAK